MHQINNIIDQADVQVRKIIHRKALFSPKWFDQHGNPRDERVLLRIAGAIILRCQKAGELVIGYFHLNKLEKFLRFYC